LVEAAQFSHLPKLKTQRIAVKLNKTAQGLVKQGHPWVFSDSIVKESHTPKSGDLAIIYDNHTNKLIALGLYDVDSSIKIKILHSGSPATINSSFFESKIQTAYAKRIDLLETKTNAYRLLFGENDSMPSFIADVYANVLVIKLYSEMWLPYLSEILPHLINVSQVDTVVLRLSRKLDQLLTSKGLSDGSVLYGKLEDEEVHFYEHGINFKANVIKGHKTGYFLDHRYNRKRVGELSKGKSVLDVFSYAGGFSVHALAKGAKEVTSLDISAQALAVAKDNATLNDHKGTHHIIEGDAFEKLQQLLQKKKKFDVVVIDPPSFAKKATDVVKALKKYTQLAKMGVQLVSKNGILVLASCSSRVEAQDFYAMAEKVLKQQLMSYKVLEKTTHDDDHPIAFAEGAYLKTIYFKISQLKRLSKF
jgi:23S rRNA (cytosine1962-C5)-methyltransferase